MTSHIPEHSELGKKSQYSPTYSPDALYPIPRQKNRDTLHIHPNQPLPFYGFDRWNHYEVSVLNPKGKPIVAIAEITYPCDSVNIIESKSMKLYFNSLNQTCFNDLESLEKTIAQDLQQQLSSSFVTVRIIPVSSFKEPPLLSQFNGTSVDELDIACSIYHTDPSLLTTDNEYVEETLCSDLLKSNCLVTHQPDWCSVQIVYQGKKINREGLLRYIVSFRNDNEFHEQCIEKIFMHLLERCKPDALTVYGRSTRRGGIDINAYRSTKPVNPTSILNQRLCRQ